ncbi:hypothetical protein DBR06_SOUSAS23110015 [Sousa chinensis]|nr:hypothetical protein DBR06_SOUSAS23110015 [Sousa chinensis]
MPRASVGSVRIWPVPWELGP